MHNVCEFMLPAGAKRCTMPGGCFPRKMLGRAEQTANHDAYLQHTAFQQACTSRQIKYSSLMTHRDVTEIDAGCDRANAPLEIFLFRTRFLFTNLQTTLSIDMESLSPHSPTPAEIASAHKSSLLVIPDAIRCSAQLITSPVATLLLPCRPPACHAGPRRPPPRECTLARIHPRSSQCRVEGLNVILSVAP